MKQMNCAPVGMDIQAGGAWRRMMIAMPGRTSPGRASQQGQQGEVAV